MRSYSEVKEQTIFNWYRFLNPDMDPSEEYWDLAISQASKWTTCAVGTQCEILPRDAGGMPKNEKLAQMGSDFYFYLQQGDRETALHLLKQIEFLAGYLIQQTRKSLRGKSR